MTEKQTNKGPEAHYFSALNSGRFIIQKCDGCAQHIFYPRTVCPHCTGTTLNWVQPSGLGSIYSNTTIHRRPTDGGDYNVCLVDLDEGVRLMGNVKGIPPSDVEIGMRVKIQIDIHEGQGKAVFQLLEEK